MTGHTWKEKVCINQYSLASCIRKPRSLVLHVSRGKNKSSYDNIGRQSDLASSLYQRKISKEIGNEILHLCKLEDQRFIPSFYGKLNTYFEKNKLHYCYEKDMREKERGGGCICICSESLWMLVIELRKRVLPPLHRSHPAHIT